MDVLGDGGVPLASNEDGREVRETTVAKDGPEDLSGGGGDHEAGEGSDDVRGYGGVPHVCNDDVMGVSGTTIAKDGPEDLKGGGGDHEAGGVHGDG